MLGREHLGAWTRLEELAPFTRAERGDLVGLAMRGSCPVVSSARTRHLMRVLALEDSEVRLLWNAKLDVAARHLLLEEEGCTPQTRAMLLVHAWREQRGQARSWEGELCDLAALRCEVRESRVLVFWGRASGRLPGESERSVEDATIRLCAALDAQLNQWPTEVLVQGAEALAEEGRAAVELTLALVSEEEEDSGRTWPERIAEARMLLAPGGAQAAPARTLTA